MRSFRPLLVALSLVLGGCLLGGLAGTARAEPPRPTNLRLIGGDRWHAQNAFGLEWEVAGSPQTAIHYRIRDAAWAYQPEAHFLSELHSIQLVRVPGPGTYTIELQLSDAEGNGGMPGMATLRFDDQLPGSARALPPPSWFGAGSPVVVKIEHPAAPLPISGIRGYALSVEQGSGAQPCAGPSLCSVEETDLGGGIGDDTIDLGILPEGLNTVHVVAVSNSGVRSRATMSTPVRVDLTPPAVDLVGAPSGWANQPVRLEALASDPLSGMAANGPNGPFTAIAAEEALPKIEFGPSTAVIVHGDGVHRVAYYGRDAAGNNGEGGTSLSPPRSTIVRIDSTAPAVEFDGRRDPSEPERLEAKVSDLLSGPSSTRGLIGVRLTGSRRQFEPLPTTVTAGRLVARWNSDAFPLGNYEFRATAYDLAGNSASSDRLQNGTRMLLSNPVKTPTTLEVGFGGRRLAWHRCVRRGERRHCKAEVIESYEGRPAKRAIPYGRGTWLGGRLASASGSPVARVPVRVVETFADGAGLRQRTTMVETDSNGAFLAGLASGPSRSVEVSFDGNKTLAHAVGRAVHLKVLAGVSLRASSASAVVGGAPVVFSGRVSHRGASIPMGGRPVQLEFRLPGSPWTEFRTVQTDAGGRFHFPYRFSDDDSRGIRFQFRAGAPTEGNWPYEAGTSRPVAVTGR
jgi:hypothetical protein